MEPETGPQEPGSAAPTGRDDQPPRPLPVLPESILPTKSREDTDVGWGEYAEQGDDERLLRDRPPHWDNA
jgi:hypothetical protein